MGINIMAFIKDILKKTTVELVVLLLATIISSLVGVVWALIDWQSFIDFLSFSIPLWAVLIFIILIVLIYCVIIQCSKNSWKSYKSDKYLGIKFTWEYGEKGKITSLKVFCPKCNTKMNGVINIDKIGWGNNCSEHYKCSICKEKYDVSEAVFMNIIETNIEKKKKKI